MKWHYDSESRRVISGIDAPAFGDKGLMVEVVPGEELLEPFEAANEAHGQSMEDFLMPKLLEAGEGGLELDQGLLEQVFAAGGEGPDEAELVAPEQLESVRWLAREQQAIYHLIYGSLRELRYDALEDERARDARRAQEQGGGDAEYDAVAYGYEDEGDDWGETDGYGAGAYGASGFDDMWEGREPEADDEDEEEEWLWDESFELDRVRVPHAGKPRSLTFTGSCSWDEEHGLGVRIEGMRVVEIGTAMGVR